jgi:Recombination endonuclease VII
VALTHPEAAIENDLLGRSRLRAICSEQGCEKPVHGRGLCSTHYERSRRPKTTCRDCGGSKPAGLGRKLCDSCLARAQEQTREKQAAYQRQRYLANREEVLARTKERDKDPAIRERKRIAAREWARQHPDRVRAQQRRNWAKRKYGLTLEEVDAILARGCAICGTHQGRSTGRASVPMGRAEERLCLDHCHTTGKVRDALCHSCNSALGLMGDDPARLRAAADYLEKHA